MSNPSAASAGAGSSTDHLDKDLSDAPPAIRLAAMSEEEAKRFLDAPSLPQAMADLLNARGLRAFITVGGDDNGFGDWEAVLVCAGPDGLAGGHTSVLQPSNDFWQRPDTAEDPLMERRRGLVDIMLRTLDGNWLNTDALLANYLPKRHAYAATLLSVLMPAWCADRVAEGYTAQAAHTMLALRVPPDLSGRLEVTETGLLSSRGFAVLTPQP